MVHALSEIQRVLKPLGTLLDLRAMEDTWPVEVVSSTGWQPSGRLEALPEMMADDEAADQAMREVESAGWFIKKRVEEFPYFYYWDTPSEMKEFTETDWEGLEKFSEEVYRKTASLWASANADARVRMRVRMHIARWEKA